MQKEFRKVFRPALLAVVKGTYAFQGQIAASSGFWGQMRPARHHHQI